MADELTQGQASGSRMIKLHDTSASEWIQVLVNASGIASGGVSEMHAKPNHLTRVTFKAPDHFEFIFEDGFFGSLTFSDLGFSRSEVLVATARAMPDGNGFEIQGKKGEAMQLDSETLRMMTDNKYEARQEAMAREYLLSSAELEKIAAKNAPPQWWYGSKEPCPF